jgi:hypothetical protein
MSHLRILFGLLTVVLVFQSAAARPKTDLVFLKNGDRITCEIRDLALGLLKVKTDSLGTVDIKWQDIEKIVSVYQFEVHLSSGRIAVGAINTLPEGRIQIENLSDTAEVDQMSIVRIDQLGESFLNRFSGALDVGLSYLSASRRSQATLTSDLEFKAEKNTVTTKVSTFLTGQEDSATTARHNLDLGYTRSLGKNWFAFGQGQFTHNREQDLDIRSLVGGGVGRALIWTNRMRFSVRVGASYSSEKFFEQERRNNSEGIFGAEFRMFKLNTPKLDLSVDYTFIPNFVTKGRYRSEFDAKARFELFKDFYWSISAFSSYDNKPASDLAQKGDFGIVTSVGWSFNR